MPSTRLPAAGPKREVFAASYSFVWCTKVIARFATSTTTRLKLVARPFVVPPVF